MSAFFKPLLVQYIFGSIRISICYCFFVALPLLVTGQSSNKSFLKFPLEINGQETSGVKAIVQDQHGYMWFNTLDGLIRFDGIQSKNYKHDPEDSTSIVENNLEILYVDHFGRLWVGSQSGLSRYQETCDCFTHYFIDPAQFKVEGNSFPPNGVVDITEDPDHNLWVATMGSGLFKYEKEEDRLVRYLANADLGPTIETDYFRKILVDKKYNIWIGTGFGGAVTGNGLIRYNLKTGSIKRFLHDPKNPNSLLDNRVSALMTDRDGKLWIGTYKAGLHYFDPEREVIVRMKENKNAPNQIHAPYSDYEVWGTDPFISILKQDSKGGYWVGTIGKGINHFDGVTRKNTFHDPAKLDRDVFKTYWTLYEDRQGQIWLGSPIGNLFKLDLYGRYFNIYPDLAAAQKGCESKIDDNIIWLGTLGNGLRKLDLNTEKITSLRHDDNNTNSLKNDIVRGVYADDDDMLWIGLGLEVKDVNKRIDKGGLNRFDINQETFNYYPVKAHDSLSASETVFTVQEDREGFIWLSTGSGGIYRSNKEKTAFKPFSFPNGDKDNFGPSVVYYVFEADDKIWACNEIDSILHYFDYDQQAFIPFLKGFTTNFIEVDQQGHYWIGTWDNGLIHLNPKDKSYTHYTTKDGLPSNHSVLALEGKSGNIWISTQKGMALFNTTTKQFITSGLPYEYFHESTLRTRDGRLIFGGNSALYTFYPGQLDGNSFAPELLLQDLQISGESYDLSVYRTDSTHQVRLAYHQNDLIFNITGFHFSRPARNQYQYRLYPFDKDWIDAGTQRTARYTNLDPGNYTFQFKAANSEGVWNEKAAAIAVYIAPFIWTTWWAILIYLILFAGLTYVWYSFQLSQRTIQQEALRLRELNEFKSRFYANITHEFRTPLTVIQGMAEALQERIEDQPKKKLGLIKRNSNRLLELVNQMLDLSKLQAGRLQVNYRQLDIITYLRYQVEAHESYARSKGLSLNFYSEQEKLMMDVDEQKIEKILTNLIVNAIKYTPEHGKVWVIAKSLKVKNEEQLQLMIQDNGLGIPEKALPHIFERYFRAHSASDETQYGTGIGLALVKELIHLLGGEIRVESTPQKGTSFILNLPIQRKSTLAQQVRSVKVDTEQEISEGVYIEQLVQNKEHPLLLLIEDNSDVAYYIQSCLQEEYQVFHYRNGKEGLQKAMELIPDIIISDVMMPGMDGFALCQQLKTDVRTNHIPIILLTAKATAEDKLVGLQHGADAYLTKPFEKEELRTRLNNLLEIRKTLQAKYSATVNDDQRSNADIRRSESSVEGSVNNLHPFLEQIESIVLNQLSNENLSVKDLSMQVHLSNSQVSRKIKALSGMSTNLFIRAIRLREAKKLLSSNSYSISEIAYQTGFSSPAYFSQIFKKEFGESPSLFQEKWQRSNDNA